MKAILDSSVAFKVVVPEEHSDKATSLMKEYRNGFHQLLAPDIFPVELAHALAALKARRCRLRPIFNL